MKKVIALVLVVALVVVGGWFVYSKLIDTPERRIIGVWNCTDVAGIGGDSSFTSYEFKEDGKVIIKAKLLPNLQYEGTYAIDSKAQTITIDYEILSVSYSNTSSFVLEDDTLTFTDADKGYVTHFERAAEEAEA